MNEILMLITKNIIEKLKYEYLTNDSIILEAYIEVSDYPSSFMIVEGTNSLMHIYVSDNDILIIPLLFKEGFSNQSKRYTFNNKNDLEYLNDRIYKMIKNEINIFIENFYNDPEWI